MTHFGLICPQLAGHLNVFIPLSQKLQQRNHRVTFFGPIDAQSQIQDAGLEFCAIGEADFPVGTTAKSLVHLGTLHGLAAMRYGIDSFKRQVAVTYMGWRKL